MQVATDAKMGVDVEEYVASFRTDLCDAVAAWSRGAKFAEIMKMTDVFEVRATVLPRSSGVHQHSWKGQGEWTALPVHQRVGVVKRACGCWSATLVAFTGLCPQPIQIKGLFAT